MAIDYRREFGGFIGELARESGEIVRGYFGRPPGEYGLEFKSDDSPVTLADRGAEEVMRRRIGREFPDHGVWGEEFGRERTDAEFVWVLDPVDGTISFAAGCPLFGTLIGLLHRGRPVLGAIHQPLLEWLCVGDGESTTLNGRATRVRACRELSDATLLVNDLAHVEAHQDFGGYDRLRRACRLQRGWGDCYGYLLLVTGGADIMLDPVMNPWDLLPLVPVVTGAGGSFTAWGGGDPVEADSCVASNPAIHGRVLAMLCGG